jgi:hypothetical protein
MANNAFDSLWREWLEEYPEIAYGAFRPQTGSPSFIDYWKGHQGDVYSDYLASLGRMTLGGQPPSLDYSSFLGNYPWMQYWQGLSPTQRGEYPSRFAPSLRWFV